ncbi:protein disulfide-isomerase A3-like isoform X2 [Scleropages formosus]|uniref:protein disulfide-isomerase A3-like isoform X2 n=1 Tax=Scleropages formosus TaxID=113540 RepID=UPI0010FABD33|nr:protein disulfide-isomerase A3-like isoform X2 [Scleropages formosus]
MVPSCALLLLRLCALPSALAAAASDVLVLRDSDFDNSVEDHETILVDFFLPRCAHCQKFAPEYERAATRLKGTAILAKVDCSTSSKTCKRFGIKRYPTLKVFRNGKEFAIYDRSHSEEGIVHYMQKQTGPSSVVLHSKEDLDAFINHSDASVVGFFPNGSNTHLVEFQKAASTLRENYRFAHTVEPGLGLLHGLEAEGVLLFRPPRLSSIFEESVKKYTGPINTSTLRRFIKHNIFGICPHVTKENREKLKGRDLLTAYYDLDYVRDPKGSNYWRNRVLKVAVQFQSRGLSFAVANRREFERELEEDFGLDQLDGGGFPLVTIRTREGHKYSMREEFTPDGKALTRFLEDYFAGRLKRYLKSQPVPEYNKSLVQTVVAETFEEIVSDPEKDVLIQLYAPWCGHCKNLEPKYNELAEQLSGDPSIVIARMDATANDIPSGYDVDGFPTIYFVPARKKHKPVKYEGELNVKDLLKFLRKQSPQGKVQSGTRKEL